MGRIKLPYYVAKNGKGYFQPNQSHESCWIQRDATWPRWTGGLDQSETAQ